MSGRATNTPMEGLTSVQHVDYSGPLGGMLGAAVISTAVAITAFWLAIAATIWKVFLDPRMKKLEKERDEERTRCDAEIDRLTNRIAQLEGALMMHGPQALREAMQIALSERDLAQRGIHIPAHAGIRLEANAPSPRAASGMGAPDDGNGDEM